MSAGGPRGAQPRQLSRPAPPPRPRPPRPLSAPPAAAATDPARRSPPCSAQLLEQDAVADLLVSRGASTERGKVIVQDHVPKVRDFFAKECWAHHPKPYQDFVDWRAREDAFEAEERERVIPSI